MPTGAGVSAPLCRDTPMVFPDPPAAAAVVSRSRSPVPEVPPVLPPVRVVDHAVASKSRGLPHPLYQHKVANRVVENGK